MIGSFMEVTKSHHHLSRPLKNAGMGKTTLAKAVYNSIVDQFECVCFLHNVRGISAKHGLEHLLIKKSKRYLK